jgi:hypothetical protein
MLGAKILYGFRHKNMNKLKKEYNFGLLRQLSANEVFLATRKLQIVQFTPSLVHNY